jgi:hypothetical protein
MFVPVTPVEIPEGLLDAWRDIHISDLINVPGVGLTGVLMRVYVTGTRSGVSFGVRKKGSTDNRVGELKVSTKHITQAACGVDSDGYFQIYDGTDIYGDKGLRFDIIGYTTTGTEFFTNAIDVSPTSASTWTAKDVSLHCPSAVGVMLSFQSGVVLYPVGARPNGSTDGYTANVYGNDGALAVLGCSANQVVDVWLYNVSVQKCYLIGYIVYGSGVFQTNGTDVTPTLNTWSDLTALDSSAAFGVYEYTPANDYSFRMRAKGDTEDLAYATYHCWWLAPCNEDAICQAYVGGATLRFLGYLPAVAVASASGNIMIGECWVG